MQEQQIKKKRLQKLKESKGLCQVCGNPANSIYDDIIVLCNKCRSIMNDGHRNKHTSKFLRQYGMTLSEMTERFGGSINRYYQLHRKGILKKELMNLRVN